MDRVWHLIDAALDAQNNAQNLRWISILVLVNDERSVDNESFVCYQFQNWGRTFQRGFFFGEEYEFQSTHEWMEYQVVRKTEEKLGSISNLIKTLYHNALK